MRTYGKLQLDDAGAIWKATALEPHVMIKLKKVFTHIPKNADHASFKNTPEHCRDLDWFVSRYPLDISDADSLKLIEGKNAHIKSIEDMEAILRPDYKPRDYAMKIPPRPYQVQPVEILYATKRLLLGDDVGLGKTIVGIAAMTRKEGLPAIVVAQTHLPTQWQQQIEKFSDLTVHVIKGTKPYTLPPADVYIMRYSCLSGWHDTYSLGIFKMAIFDECQELRIQDSNKYRAAKKLSESVEYCLGLSATPVYNYGDEMYSIMNLIKPGCLGDWGDFSREWCHNYGRSVHNPKALGAHLRENHLFIRRTKADVGREMPALTKIVHEIDFDEKELKKIEDISRQLAITTLFGTFTERGMAGRELDLRLRYQTGVGKARYVAEYVKVLLESGTPVLLAAWHRDVYEIYNEVLIDHKPVMYTGSESSSQKEKSKMAFISGEANLMIISLRSGIGLDGLQERCSTVVFGELDWSGQVHEQVIGRVNRDGQKDPVTAIFLTVNEGSDPPMVELLGVKSSQSKNIIDPFSGAEVQNSDDSRVKALAESVLRARGVDVEALRKEHAAKKASNQVDTPGVLT